MEEYKMYYIYELQSPLNNEVFYVGYSNHNRKTSQPRPIDHIQEAKRGVDTLKCRIINKILSTDNDIIVNITFKSQDLNEVLFEEKRLITYYGRRDLGTGTLANHTDGGTGGNTTIGLSQIELSQRGKSISNGHKSQSIEKKKEIADKKSIAQKKAWQKKDIREKRVIAIRRGIKKRNKAQHALRVSNGYKSRSIEEQKKTSVKKSKITKEQWKVKKEIMYKCIQKMHEENCQPFILLNIETNEIVNIKNPNQWCKKWCQDNRLNYNTIYAHLLKLKKGKKLPKKSPLNIFKLVY